MAQTWQAQASKGAFQSLLFSLNTMCRTRVTQSKPLRPTIFPFFPCFSPVRTKNQKHNKEYVAFVLVSCSDHLLAEAHPRLPLFLSHEHMGTRRYRYTLPHVFACVHTNTHALTDCIGTRSKWKHERDQKQILICSSQSEAYKHKLGILFKTSFWPQSLVVHNKHCGFCCLFFYCC